MVENIILVTEQDKFLGVAEKIKVHREGLCHRAFSVFIMRKTKKGSEILLQKRALHKYHSAGLWSNTCCGHPRPGEKVKQAARRRLKEEMGLSIKLAKIGVFHYFAKLNNLLIENEVDHVFIGIYNDENFTVNPKEVADFCWISCKKLALELRKHSKKYTAWFNQAFRLVEDKLKGIKLC